MIDLKMSQLRLLESLAETGSLTQAAKAQGMSVSAASRSIRQLQDYFHDPLFVRTYGGMVPTHRVERLLPGVRELLSGFDGLENASPFVPHHLEQVLTIGAADNAIVAILMPIIAYLTRACPKLQFRILPLQEQFLDKLTTGEWDFVLYPTIALSVLPPHFKSLNLYRLEGALLVASDHPLAKAYARGKLPTTKQVAQYPTILVKLQESSRGAVFNCNLREKQPTKVVVELPYFLGAPYFLKNSLNVLTLPRPTAEFFASQLNGLTAIPWRIPGQEAYTRLIWHERSDQTPSMQWIRSVIKEYAGAMK